MKTERFFHSFALARLGRCPVWRLLAFVPSLTWAANESAASFPAVDRAQHAVAFRLAWPKPAAVELVARGPNQHDFPHPVYAMKPVAEGSYEVTVTPVPPGVHFYKFRVDGADVLDPLNPLVQDFFNGPWSRFDMPEAGPRPWTFTAGIPHGTLEQRRVPSLRFNDERPLWVYLPPGYPTESSAAYPVLYLFHGSTYDPRSWTELGRVPEIVDSLVHAGRIRPLVIVMPYGYNALPERADVEPPREFVAWSGHIVEELIPWVNRHYRVSDQREQCALAGLSLGGGQALRIGFQFPERFMAIGAFSGGENGTGLLSLRESAGGPKPLVWFGCGTGDRHYAHNRELAERLSREGMATRWHDYAGRHTWNVWRQCLADFLPVAFPPRP